MPTTATPRMKHAITGPVRTASRADRPANSGHAPRSGRPVFHSPTEKMRSALDLVESHPNRTWNEYAEMAGCTRQIFIRRIDDCCRMLNREMPRVRRGKFGPKPGTVVERETLTPEQEAEIAATMGTRIGEALLAEGSYPEGAVVPLRPDDTRTVVVVDCGNGAARYVPDFRGFHSLPPRAADEAEASALILRKIVAAAIRVSPYDVRPDVEWYRQRQLAYFKKHPLRRMETYRGESVFYIGRDQ